MARPTKLTAARAQEILGYVEAGASRDVAARAAGISPTALHDWIARGRKEADRLDRDPTARIDPAERIYLQFAESIEKADALAELRMSTLVRQHAVDSWQAAMTWLERRHPERWAKRVTVDAAPGAIERAMDALVAGPKLPGEDA